MISAFTTRTLSDVYPFATVVLIAEIVNHDFLSIQLLEIMTAVDSKAEEEKNIFMLVNY